MDNNREEEVGEEMHRGELGSEHAPRPAAPPRLVAHPRSQPWSFFSTSSSSPFPSTEVSLPFSTSAAGRRGRVSRWSSRTREAQWEEEQTADLSGAHCIFPAKTRVTILKRESVLS